MTPSSTLLHIWSEILPSTTFSAHNPLYLRSLNYLRFSPRTPSPTWLVKHFQRDRHWFVFPPFFFLGARGLNCGFLADDISMRKAIRHRKWMFKGHALTQWPIMLPSDILETVSSQRKFGTSRQLRVPCWSQIGQPSLCTKWIEVNGLVIQHSGLYNLDKWTTENTSEILKAVDDLTVTSALLRERKPCLSYRHVKSKIISSLLLFRDNHRKIMCMR